MRERYEETEVFKKKSMEMTPLWLAAEGNNRDIIGHLLAYGAAPQLGRCSTLHWACQYGYSFVAETLLEQGADPDSMDDGQTPLSKAVEKRTRGSSKASVRKEYFNKVYRHHRKDTPFIRHGKQTHVIDSPSGTS